MAKKNFETALTRLEQITSELEDGDISLLLWEAGIFSPFDILSSYPLPLGAPSDIRRIHVSLARKGNGNPYSTQPVNYRVLPEENRFEAYVSDDLRGDLYNLYPFRQTIAKGPALATLWLGNNDVLGAALSGNPNNPTPITPLGAFTEQYTDLLSMLAGGLAQRTGWDPEAETGVQPTIVFKG